MLTGDKHGTAMQIARTCNIIGLIVAIYGDSAGQLFTEA